MLSSEFQSIGKVKIGGKRGELKKYVHGNWYRFGKRNVRAESETEAVEKLEKTRKKNAS